MRFPAPVFFARFDPVVQRFRLRFLGTSRWITSLVHIAVSGLIFYMPFMHAEKIASAMPAHPGIGHKSISLPVIVKRDIHFNRVSGNEGLSQVRVAQITQDDQGFMWFGTQYGLDRFDGYKFKVFRNDRLRPDSLSGVYIRSLFKDRKGNLWVGCDQFLDKFDPKTEVFSHYRLGEKDTKTPNPTINHISQDSTGILWLSTGRGLYSLNPDTSRITLYTHSTSDSSSLSNSDIKSTGEDRNGGFWVATRDGLDKFDRKTGKVLRHIPLSDSGHALWFHQDRYGVFWLVYGADGILATLDPATYQVTDYALGGVKDGDRSRSKINTMLEDSAGEMWFGSDGNGILRFDRQAHRFLAYKNDPSDVESIAHNRVSTLFQDREGNIWAGLHELAPNFFSKRPALFKKFSHQTGNPNSLTSSLVTTIFEESPQSLLVGSTGSLQRINLLTGQYSVYSSKFEGTDILNIAKDNHGQLWFGTAGKGVYRLDPRTGKVKNYDKNSLVPGTLSSNHVQRFLIDESGALWAATWTGLNKYDPVTDTFTAYHPETGGENFYAFVKDGNRAFWVGSNLGLYHFDPATHTAVAYRHNQEDPNSLSDSRVNSIYIDHAGRTWIGTQNGLDRLNPEKGSFTTYSEREGLNGNVVSCILEDDVHRLWMSTNKGISRFDPSSGSFDNYTPADGLPGPDLTGWGACMKRSTGEFYFGGFSGATAFYPKDVIESPAVPPIVLTDFRIAGVSLLAGKNSPLQQSISYARSIVLAHNQNVFSIEFAALSYFNTTTNRYRYKLDGIDREWNNVESEQRIATYTTLPPGTYTFHVQGSTGRGSWSEPGAALRIQILPPWWNTWQFRSSYIAGILLLAWGIYRHRCQQNELQFQIRLEERVSERTRIARELHDTLLQNFQGLVLSFQAVASTVPPNERTHQLMNAALDKADQALVKGRDSIANLRIGTEPCPDLAVSFAALGQELGVDNAVAFQLRLQGKPRSLHPAVQEEIFRIGKEALTNAFQHSQATEIEAEILYTRNRISFRFRDNGRGIDTSVLEKGGLPGHWGLIGMRERAERIHSELKIWSEAGAGTEVALDVPAPKARRFSMGKLFKRSRVVDL